MAATPTLRSAESTTSMTSTIKSNDPSTKSESRTPSVTTTKSNDPTGQQFTGLKLFVLLGSLTIVTFLSQLDTSIIGTAIPAITTEFHSLTDIGWYVGAYTLAAATLQPISGKLYTYFPTKAVFLSFVFLFELGSLLCGVAQSSPMLIIGRAVAGIGVSGIFNGAITVITSAVGKEKVPLYFGVLLGISQMGIVAGPLVGGALTEHASWRWCFYINLPVGGLAAFILMFITFPEIDTMESFSMALVRKVIPELDLIGFAFFVPASLMFLLALQFGSGNTHAWDSATVIGLFVGAGVLAIVFVLWERRVGDRAMIPGSVVGQRVVWASCTFGACNVTCMMVASNWLPTYFQAVKGDGPTMSGVHLLPSILSQVLFVITSGALISKLGYYLPWAFGGAAVTAIGNGLISTFSPTTTVAQWIGYQIIMGAGRGAAVQTPLVAVQNAVKPAHLQVAMAFLVFSQNFGVSVGIVLSQTAFAETLTSTIPRYAPSISPQAALNAGSGAGAVRDLVIGHEDELNGVLLAYSESLRNVFYFLVGLAALAVALSLGMGWVDVRKKEEPAKPYPKGEADKEKVDSVVSIGV